jgi:acylphosphatase
VIARHLEVRGRVQGVGFRISMGEVARDAGVTGWVRNRSDGSVEAVVQGSPDDVARVIAWTRSGPRGAHVAYVAESEAPVDSARRGFHSLPTAGSPAG